MAQKDIKVLANLGLYGSLRFAETNTDFPENPSIGDVLLKGTELFAYVKIGDFETWYPFANSTNAYIHTQGVSSALWTVTHNLGTTDIWTQIRDSSNNIVNAGLINITANSFQIQFTEAIQGTVIVVAPDSIDVPAVTTSSITVGTVEITGSNITINGNQVLTAGGTGSLATIATTGSFNDLVDVPTTLAGYGITDAQAKDADLTAIAALNGTGFAKRTGVDTWTLDNSNYITANQNITISGDASGSGSTSISLTLANSGVSAGSYKSVTVDAKGRVTAGSNPTTLAGFGITDAAPLTHVGSGGSAHAQATTSSSGFMSPSDKSKLDGIEAGANNYSLPVADISTLGGVKDGPGVTIAVDGTISANVLSVNGSTGNVVISDITGNAGTATALETSRSFTISGDASWTVDFDGTSDVSAALTLANSGVTAGTFKSVTVDAKGRVTAGSNPTTLAGFGITDTITNTVNGRSGAVTLTKSDVGLANVENKSSATIRSEITSTNVTTALGFTPEDSANKGVANGYAGLDSNGKIAISNIPAAAITDTYVVASEAAMLAISGADHGDVAVRTDLNKSFILMGTDHTVLGDWQELLTPTDQVQSVNGMTGTVTISTISGNAGSATVLQTPRTFTIGSTGKSFDGSANVSWTLGEIGAQPVDADLTAIAALAGTSGFLKKTAADTWTLDTNSYSLSSHTHSQISNGTSNVNIASSAGDVTIAVAGLERLRIDTTGEVSLRTSANLVLAGGQLTTNSGSNPLPFGINGVEKARIDISGNLLVNTASSSGSYKLEVSGDAKVSGAVAVSNGQIQSATLTTSATTAGQVVASFAAASFRSAKFMIQAVSGTSYHVTEVTVIHDGTTPYITETGTIFTGSSLATFDTDISSGNVRLLTTPTNAVTVYKVMMTLINA